MKILILTLGLICTACSTDNQLEKLCLQKDPNQMTEREIDLCKAFLQRPVIQHD